MELGQNRSIHESGKVLSQEDLEIARLEFETEVLDVFRIHGLKDRSFNLGPIQRAVSEGGNARSLIVSWIDNNGLRHEGAAFRKYDRRVDAFTTGIEVDIFS